MCTMSMIADHYRDKFERDRVWWPEPEILTIPVSRAEFDELRRSVEDMKILLQKAKVYDEENDQPECENADKIAVLKKLAELVGVDLGDLSTG